MATSPCRLPSILPISSGSGKKANLRTAPGSGKKANLPTSPGSGKKAICQPHQVPVTKSRPRRMVWIGVVLG